MVYNYSSATRVWSGRRGSNPRPTAWKAVTLPLSYSRLRYAPPLGRSPESEAPLRHRRAHSSLRAPDLYGGEGRVRTSVAARAADLQSAAIDRSATSPIFRSRMPGVRHRGD